MTDINRETLEFIRERLADQPTVPRVYGAVITILDYLISGGPNKAEPASAQVKDKTEAYDFSQPLELARKEREAAFAEDHRHNAESMSIFEMECMFYYYAIADEGDFKGGFGHHASDALLSRTFNRLCRCDYLMLTSDKNTGRKYQITEYGRGYVYRLRWCK